MPFEVLTDCNLDIEDDILISKTEKAYLSMDDEEVLFSEDRFCYGYPMSLKDLEEMYKDIGDEQERVSKYFDELNKTVFFGKHNIEEGKLDLILTNKDILVNTEDENWFSEYMVSSDNVEFVNISLHKNGLKEINEALEKKEYDKIKQLFQDVTSVVEELQNIIGETKEVDVNIDEKQDKTDPSKIEASLEKLNGLIGLENVKKEVMIC